MNSASKRKADDNFLVVSSALLLFMFVIVTAAVLIVRHEKVVMQEGDITSREVVEDRIRPIGDVQVAGQDITLHGQESGAANTPSLTTSPSQLATQTAAAATATEASATGAAAMHPGEAIYNSACIACHGLGVAGAPKMGDTAQWAPRIATGMDTLNQNAINGYTGNAGIMPAKGGRMDLSDEQVIASVKFMVEKSR